MPSIIAIHGGESSRRPLRSTTTSRATSGEIVPKKIFSANSNFVTNEKVRSEIKGESRVWRGQEKKMKRKVKDSEDFVRVRVRRV